jgi:hypothetical protein
MPASGASLADVAAVFGLVLAVVTAFPVGADGREQLSSAVIDTASTRASAVADIRLSMCIYFLSAAREPFRMFCIA